VTDAAIQPDGADRPPAPDMAVHRHGGGHSPDEGVESERDHLTTVQGISAFCLDALSSVAYGPEAIALVLVAAGAAALRDTIYVSLVIVLLLAVLTLSYRQVIKVFPNGGGAYAVAKESFGPTTSLLAAASLVVDYVLTVAVSLAAGAASLASTFPALRPDVLAITLAALVFLAALNLRGVAESAKVLLVPTALFVVAVYATIVGDLVHTHPAATIGGPAPLDRATEALGVILLLKAFAQGCSAVTGVEAIANGVPAFRENRVKRAQRTEVALGTLLGSMLLGLAFAAHHLQLRPKGTVTLLAQLTAAGLGHGPAFYVTGIAVTVVLGVAANTSFAGLPVLMSLLSQDNRLPHVFALRSHKPLYRYGIVTLAVLAGILLVAVDANTNRLLPLYAIGVFIGFTISQSGLVRHWFRERPRRWMLTAGLNSFGAVLTATATVVFLASKFLAGAWVVTVAIPLLMLLFWRISVYYRLAAAEIGLGSLPPKLAVRPSVVVVPVVSITRMTALALAAAGSLGGEVIAVSVQPSPAAAEDLQAQWDEWAPGVPLRTMIDPRHTLVGPLLRYVRELSAAGDRQVTVLVPELTPSKRRHEFLHNQRGRILTTLLRQRTDAVVATIPFRLHD
jgi:amino acid transporter